MASLAFILLGIGASLVPFGCSPFWFPPITTGKIIEGSPDDALVVVSHDGRIFSKSQLVTQQELTEHLRSLRRGAAVRIAADRRTAFNNVLVPIAAARAAGISKIVFISEYQAIAEQSPH